MVVGRPLFLFFSSFFFFLVSYPSPAPFPGQSGLGKTTFVKTLVGKELIAAKEYDQFNDLSERTVDISSYSEGLKPLPPLPTPPRASLST